MQEVVNAAGIIFNDYMLLDPRLQVAGVAVLMDCSGFSLKGMQNADRNLQKLSTKYFQVCAPIVLKHAY